MWTRRELKEKARERIRVNYWKCVLVALLLSLIGFGAGTGSSSYLYSWLQGEESEDGGNDFDPMDENGEYQESEKEEEAFDVDLDELFSKWGKKASTMPNGEIDTGKGISIMFFFMMLIMILFITLVVALVVVLPLEIFIVNPLEVGIRRFFQKNLKEEANLREICYAFDHHYKNSVKIMFFRDLYVFLWSLLFLIPGIIKAYEYRMVPYVLEEHPDIRKEEAFARSRSLMSGNRWKAFVLDLSFLGWYILSGMTMGVLGIFYVAPYVAQTRAALYQKLKERNMEKEFQKIQE